MIVKKTIFIWKSCLEYGYYIRFSKINKRNSKIEKSSPRKGISLEKGMKIILGFIFTKNHWFTEEITYV